MEKKLGVTEMFLQKDTENSMNRAINQRRSLKEYDSKKNAYSQNEKETAEISWT